MEELGVLLWAITWDGNQELRHSLGMGKPFGLGQISMHVDWESSTIISNKPNEKIPGKEDYINTFKQFMEKNIQGWETTVQLVQLKAMADPHQAPGLPGELSHMKLNGGGRNNEFTLAKGARRYDKLVLQHYTTITGMKPDHSDKIPVTASGSHTPEEQWLNKTAEELSKKHHTDQKSLMLGKLIALEWVKIEDLSLKENVLGLIMNFWLKNGGWDGPHSGKSRKTAFKIYTGEMQT